MKKLVVVYLSRDPTYYIGEAEFVGDLCRIHNFLHVVILFDPSGRGTQISLFADPFFEHRELRASEVQIRELSEDNRMDRDYIQRYATVQAQLKAMRSGIAIPQGTNTFKPEIVT